MGQEVLLHVADAREEASALRAHVRFVADPAERLSGQPHGQLLVSVDQAVLLEVAVARELAVAPRAPVDLVHAAAAVHRKVVEAKLAAPLVLVKVLLHVAYPRELAATVSTHVLLLGVPRLRPLGLWLRLMATHVLAETDGARRREGAHRTGEPVLVGVTDEVRPQRRRRRVPVGNT